MRLPAVLFVSLLVLALGGCGGKSQPDVKYRYPANVQGNFLKACEGGQRSTRCRCLLQALENRVPYDRFRTIDRDVARKSLPPEIVAAVRACQRPRPKGPK